MVRKDNKNRIVSVHRVTKKLSNGTKRFYHYVFRGGPKFWSSDMEFDVSDERYVSTFECARQGKRATPSIGAKTTRAILKKYRESVVFTKLAKRTQSDYNGFLDDLEGEFGDDPIALFEELDSVSEIREWRNKWKHSLKRYDYAGTVVTTFLNWACNVDTALRTHHHKRAEEAI